MVQQMTAARMDRENASGVDEAFLGISCTVRDSDLFSFLLSVEPLTATGSSPAP